MRKPAAKAQLDDEYSIADRAWELLDASDGPDLATQIKNPQHRLLIRQAGSHAKYIRE